MRPKPKFRVGQVVRDNTDPEHTFGKVIWRKLCEPRKDSEVDSLLSISLGVEKPEWFYCVGGEANIVAGHWLRALTRKEYGK